MKKELQSGFSLVEALLSIAIFGLIVTAFVGSIIFGQQSTLLAGNRARAVFIAEEGLEAVRNIRDPDFANLTNGTFGLATTGNQWTLSGTSNTIDIFTRQVQIQTVDADRKRIISTVTWQQNPQRTGSVTLETYLTNWIKAVGGWSSPTVEASFNFDAGNSGDATANPISIFIAGNFAYVGRTNGAGREFYIFNISNPASPVLVGQRDLNGNPNDIVVIGNYAYIASSDNSSELQIIDISDPATIANAGKLTSIDLTNANSGGNNNDAVRVAAAGSSSYLIMLRNGGDEVLIFSLSNPSAPGNPVGRTAAVSGTPVDLSVYSSDYAYIASTDTTAEVQVINMTNKNAPTRPSVLNLALGGNPMSISVAGSYLAIGRAANASAGELFSASLSSPAAPTFLSSFEIGFNVTDIDYDSVQQLGFVATAQTTNDMKVFNFSNLSSFSAPIAQLNIADSPARVDYDDALNRLIVADNNDSAEFIILKPN